MTSETARSRPRSFWIELPILLLVAVIVAVLVRTFLVQTFYIPSGSMETTLLVNDRVLVNKVVYNFRKPHRGEVVVFVPPKDWDAADKDDYIKRVVGVGGDRVVCCDGDGRITINGKALKEDYLFEDDAPSAQSFDVTVPNGRLFVLGDHRSASADSRFHLTTPQNGTIPVDAVVGRAFVIFWPTRDAGSLSVPKGYDDLPEPSDD